MKKIFLILFITLSLTGCLKTPDPIIKEKFVPFDLDQKLLTTKKIPEPPKPEEFKYLSLEEQRQVLFVYSVKLLGDLKISTSQIEKIKDVHSKHMQRVEEMNAKVKEKK